MNPQEIYTKINQNDEKIRDLLTKSVLTDEIEKLLEENSLLREQCKHEFKDGFCIYCKVPEELI